MYQYTDENHPVTTLELIDEMGKLGYIANRKTIKNDIETALYLHGLTDREYSKIHVSVPKNHNTFRLKEKGLIIHSYDEELYQMGIIEVESNYGNLLRIYDKERCICDMVAECSDVEVQTFQTAMKEYMSSSEKKMDVLLMYAEKLGLRDEIMKYVEVML